MTIPCGSAPNRCTTPPGSKRWRAASRLGRSFESAPPEAAGKFGLSSREFPGRHQRNTGMDKAPQVKLHSTAHYFLDGLNDIGIEYLFSNFGTDHAPLIEEMARWKKSGRHYPKVVNCPHENTAMHMAAGFAMATGRGQAVMVHVDAGTANSAMAMHNARRRRAGRRQAAVGETSGDGHFVRWAQPRGAGADRRDRAPRGNPRVRGGPSLSQHLARLAVLCRNDTRHRRGRRRAARRRGRAVDSEAHERKSADLVGAHRRGRREGMLPDLGLRLERAPPGRQRFDPETTARGAEGESDTRVPPGRGEEAGRDEARKRGAARESSRAGCGEGLTWRDQPALPLLRNFQSDRR